MKLRITLSIVLITILLFASCTSEKVVNTGLDNARNDGFPMFKGKSVGIVTNHTAVDRNGDHLVDLLNEEEGVKVKAIFAPEHGFRGDVEGGLHLEDNIDPQTGAPIYSLYGKTRKPTPEMLEGVDVLIFDIQDIGARFYTYISTMGRSMEGAAENGIPVYIMDRPNPIGRLAEGPIMQQEFMSGIGMYPIPIRHGLTVGELALMIKDNGWVGFTEDLDLNIVKVSGWDPYKSFRTTDLTWVDPSPNMRNLNEALLYPGMCLFEATNFSDGRGTEHPFEWVGAGYIDNELVIEELRKRNIPGVEYEAIEYVPVDMPGYAMNPKFKGEVCHGISMTVTDPVDFRSVEFGVHFIHILQTLDPRRFQYARSADGQDLGKW
ncbi:MAG: DUF1343 domain-containing protein [Candidatus Marinimicrobia bacterium]|nr:DUF1343 domain-containing protein [Candidatus Neomarinimicrobiota bacterium]